MDQSMNQQNYAVGKMGNILLETITRFHDVKIHVVFHSCHLALQTSVNELQPLSGPSLPVTEEKKKTNSLDNL